MPRISDPEAFTGMQDPKLILTDDHPLWSNLRLPVPQWVVEEREGPSVDVSSIPDLHVHPHPMASRVLQALNSLGAFDQ